MGEDIDGRADQYSLAATAYHLLTGSQLFPHSNPAVVISRHLNSPPPALAETRPELAALDPALSAALAKDPDDRFARCAEFAQALASPRVRARRTSRRTTRFRTRKWPCGHGTAPSAPQQVQARIRSSTRHWLSQEDDALVYAREVHMDCSRVRRDADDRADLVHIGIFPLEECPHPKVLGVELIRSSLDILRRRHK
jgi:hypothetical protein